MELSKHFKLVELVPKEIYSTYGENSIWFIDLFSVKGLDVLRDLLGIPITINDWHLLGQYNYSGFRPWNYKEGAKQSIHKLGKAWDVKVKGMTGDELREFVRKNWKKLSPYFTTIEKDTATWLHIDSRCILNSGVSSLPFEVPFQ